MKRLGIIGFQGIACAFAAAAINKLQSEGVDIYSMSYHELEERALENPPIDFPIYTDNSITPPQQRFLGYMKNARRRRF